MRNALLAFIVFGLLALLVVFGLSIYRNSDVPKSGVENNAPALVDDPAGSGDVPKGYFDLRGNKEILISLQEFDINPEKIVIDRGTKIIWKNSDQVFHRAVSDEPLFDSQNIKSGGNFQMVFNDAGIFNYHCSFHADTMKGIIVVDE